MSFLNAVLLLDALTELK